MSNTKPKETVVLIHGLAESSDRMEAIGFWLAQMGYPIVNVDYPSTSYNAEELINNHFKAILMEYSEKPVSFVTHSLGGVLLHCSLQKYPLPNLKRVVMIAPGHKGSEIFTLYRYNPIFSQFMGPILQESGRDQDCFSLNYSQQANYEVGIIAGCLPSDPISLFTIPWPHDGRLSVDSTRLKGMKDHMIVPAGHEFITFNPIAIAETIHFLEHGYFLKNVLDANPLSVEKSFQPNLISNTSTPLQIAL